MWSTGADRAPLAVIARDITKTFRDGAITIHALRHVNLHVHDREILCILGPNGAGKSTLLRIIAGLLKPDRGYVLVYGHDPHRHPRARRLIGYMPQDPAYLETLTVEENIRLALKAKGLDDPKLARETLETLNLAKLADRKPPTLSMGQRRLLQLAMAIAHHPRLLLADEPTANLDEDNARLVLDVLRELNKDGTTIIIATHDPLATRTATRTILLRDGTIVGAPAHPTWRQGLNA